MAEGSEKYGVAGYKNACLVARGYGSMSRGVGSAGASVGNDCVAERADGRNISNAVVREPTSPNLSPRRATTVNPAIPPPPTSRISMHMYVCAYKETYVSIPSLNGLSC